MCVLCGRSQKKRLLQAGADLDLFGEAGQDWAAFRSDGGGHDHAIGLNATKFARGKIHDHDDLAPYQ